MAPSVASVKELSKGNPTPDFLAAAEILLKLANNILNSPTNPKYRKLRLANETVQNKLLPVSGAMECLFDMGFVEDEDCLTLPIQVPLTSLALIRDEIKKETQTAKEENSSKPVASATFQPQSVRVSSPDLHVSELEFFTKLQTSSQSAMKYEDISLQEKARKVIPIQDLMKISESKYQSIKDSQDEGCSVGVDIQDIFLLELINWFKTSFFSWVNSPKCEYCGGDTFSVGPATPSPQELRWGGGRVENYQCGKCQGFTRFPRYNDPEKLLETRKGRCGEWANCFTLCCRAVGFEARYVLDWTDHVWTEVYSSFQKRWLHCDPCENVCDKPLLYEKGWGKKLSYIIAFSREEVLDVTWRYSCKHKEILGRRNKCRESWLVDTIFQMNSEKQLALSASRKQVLLQRLIVELVEFVTPKTGDNEELSGRISGSVAWRVARGETGEPPKPKEAYVFSLNESERRNQILHLRYNPALDCYIRGSGDRISGYESCLFEAKNIFRKEEKDWEMVYLARTENSPSSEITWKFDFSDSEYVVDHIDILVSSTTYEDGIVTWTLCSGDFCALVRATTEVQKVEDLDGCNDVCLTAMMRGGKGDIAWQHTQLFRQSLQDKQSFPLDIKIHLKPKKSHI
ncbi:hypothetical protein ScPMuIL_018147 [Solemya velum]